MGLAHLSAGHRRASFSLPLVLPKIVAAGLAGHHVGGRDTTARAWRLSSRRSQRSSRRRRRRRSGRVPGAAPEAPVLGRPGRSAILLRRWCSSANEPCTSTSQAAAGCPSLEGPRMLSSAPPPAAPCTPTPTDRTRAPSRPISKSLGADRSSEHGVLDPAEHRRALLSLAEEIAARLRDERQAAGGLALSVRDADRTSRTRTRALPEATVPTRPPPRTSSHDQLGRRPRPRDRSGHRPRTLRPRHPRHTGQLGSTGVNTLLLALLLRLPMSIAGFRKSAQAQLAFFGALTAQPSGAAEGRGPVLPVSSW